MNLKLRLKRIERNSPELKRPPRGSTTSDQLLSMLAGIRLRRDPGRHDATREDLSPLEYAEIQRTIAYANQRWDEVDRWDAEVDRHVPDEVKAAGIDGRLRWIRQRHIARHRQLPGA